MSVSEKHLNLFQGPEAIKSYLNPDRDASNFPKIENEEWLRNKPKK